MGEVFEAQDSISIIKKEGSRTGKSKAIKNNLDNEIRLVILSEQKGKPVLVPVGSTQSFPFSFWHFSNKIEIYT